jgi:hypothetical protein
MTDIEFKIGEEHENMKGAFKVLAVSRDAIRICWESGEEATTTVAQQNRIIERMRHQLALMRCKKGGKSKKAQLPAYLGKFEGLTEHDFSEDGTGATWRHCDSLGGAVAVRLNSGKFDIASWPRYGLSEIYWADLNHRQHSDVKLQPKFFARLDEDCLHCGLSIGRSNEATSGRDDWSAFIEWLREAENESWLKKIASEHDFSVYDIEEEGAFAGTIMPAGEKWCLSNEGRKQEIESLADFLSSLTDSARVDLQIAKIVDKDKVVPRGVEIADDIAQLFEVLMPLYEASVV